MRWGQAGALILGLASLSDGVQAYGPDLRHRVSIENYANDPIATLECDGVRRCSEKDFVFCKRGAVEQAKKEIVSFGYRGWVRRDLVFANRKVGQVVLIGGEEHVVFTPSGGVKVFEVPVCNERLEPFLSASVNAGPMQFGEQPDADSGRSTGVTDTPLQGDLRQVARHRDLSHAADAQQQPRSLLADVVVVGEPSGVSRLPPKPKSGQEQGSSERGKNDGASGSEELVVPSDEPGERVKWTKDEIDIVAGVLAGIVASGALIAWVISSDKNRHFPKDNRKQKGDCR